MDLDINNIVNIIAIVFGGSGILTGWAAWRKSRPEKISYEIKNLRDIIEEIKKTRTEDKIEVEEKMDKQEKKIQELELRDDVKSRAISQWMKCHFIPSDNNCPVAEFLDSSEKIIQKKIDKLRKEQEDEQ